MNSPILPRLGASCGAVFAVVLTVAAGDGSQGFSTPRATAGAAALALAVPFIATVVSRLREADGAGWLSSAAAATGVAGLTLKMASGAPDLAQATTTANPGLAALANALTVLSLYPLALFCAATAIVALRTRALPVWLGILTAIVALALAANGSMLRSDNVPALLLFAVWSFVLSGYLLVRPRLSLIAQPVPAL